jgi:hypothetical protein
MVYFVHPSSTQMPPFLIKKGRHDSGLYRYQYWSVFPKKLAATAEKQNTVIEKT